MFDFTPYERLAPHEVYPALVQKARELAIAKGQTTLTDVEVMQQLVRAHPEVYEYLRCKTMGMPVPRELLTPVQKADNRPWQAYAPLDFPHTQAKLLDVARADALSKGLVAKSDPEVMTAYFASHPEAYDLYRFKANGGGSVPPHLRSHETDVRQRADEIVLFRKVVDATSRSSPGPAVERLRRLDKRALYRELVAMARESVRKSAELTDCSDAVALDVLFSYREDLYRLWQETQAA